MYGIFLANLLKEFTRKYLFMFIFLKFLIGW